MPQAEDLVDLIKVFIDLPVSELVEQAIKRNEGILADNKALRVTTGQRTGRSPQDRFLVSDDQTEKTIDWGAINQPISQEKFNTLEKQALAYLKNREVFISHLRVGADDTHFLPLKVMTDTAWQNLFARQLFIRPALPEKSNKPIWTIIAASGLKLDPERDNTRSDGIVIINITQRKVLLCGMQYAGEIKKAMFSVLNYLLPQYDVLPMHCAANVGKSGDVALFFGLSGTGKTTLSADPNRYLIGDDEHGWSDQSVFNFEGGCYAKCIDLSKEREPVIWDAIRFGTIMENVILDPTTLKPNYSDGSLTQNTRAAYPREHISMRVEENKAAQPQAVIFLTCDLYSILPPVARLTKEQAAYHFLSGYTALVGSTEMGQTAGIKPTFSTCFGAPFFPRPAQVYADLLMKRIEKSGCQVYLVNTGWTGGAYGMGGERFAIPTTRAIINVILNQELKHAQFEELPGFKLSIPTSLNNIDQKILNPKRTWKDPKSYDEQANVLIEKFINNFNSKFSSVSERIRAAGPEKY